MSIELDKQESAVLIGAEIKKQSPLLSLEESLAELGRLADTAGIEVIGTVTQRLNRVNPATFIGTGKVEETRNLVEELEPDILIFDDELSPRHQRELEEVFGEDVRLVDRTALILDIFAQHAHTREGQLQVELAQLEYRLPRLTRLWTHLARQAGGRAGGGTGGGVGLRGPGETQLEVDRRIISQRIAQIKSELEKVRAHRSRYRAQRRRSGIPIVAIVGYTNAGKSTLLNQLSGANVLVEDKLFATLDPTTRRVDLPAGQAVLFTDTVGFIQKLPTALIAAFRATLEEITEADLLLHVIDATHPQALAQAEAVIDTLGDLEVDTLPMVVALNKVDRIARENRGLIRQLAERLGRLSSFDCPMTAISAFTGEGLDELLSEIEAVALSTWLDLEVIIPHQDGRLVAAFHQQGIVDQEHHIEEGVVIRGRVPGSLAYLFEDYRK